METKVKDILKTYDKIQKKCESATGLSFWGGGMQRYKHMQKFIDRNINDDTVVNFNTHSGYLVSDKYPDEKMKIVLMLVGVKEDG